MSAGTALRAAARQPRRDRPVLAGAGPRRPACMADCRVRLARLPPMSIATPAWPPLLASLGIGARSSPHAHHGMHFVVAAHGELEVRAGASSLAMPGVLTAPDVSHALDARDREVLLVFVDPESDAGSALTAALPGPVRALDAADRAALYTRDAMA